MPRVLTTSRWKLRFFAWVHALQVPIPTYSWRLGHKVRSPSIPQVIDALRHGEEYAETVSCKTASACGVAGAASRIAVQNCRDGPSSVTCGGLWCLAFGEQSFGRQSHAPGVLMCIPVRLQRAACSFWSGWWGAVHGLQHNTPTRPVRSCQ